MPLVVPDPALFTQDDLDYCNGSYEMIYII